MDLLQEVLLRLPPRRWISAVQSGFVTGGYPALLRQLNIGKSSLLVERYLSAISENLEEHETLCYQGLLAPEAINHIPIRMLLARAAFLRDKEMYVYFAARCPQSESSRSHDLAMISDVPEIIAAALTMPGVVKDPELIRWTPGMIRYYTGLNIEHSYDTNWLNGYIHYPINRIVTSNTMVIIDYVQGYIAREMQKYPDPFVELPDINRLIADYLVEKPLSMYMLSMYMASGYFPPSIFSTNSITAEIIEMAFEYVQPKFIRKFLASVRNLREIFIRSVRQVRYSLIDRAEEMLPLAESIFPPDSEYVLSLRVLTGRRIDPNLLFGLIDELPTTLLSSESHSGMTTLYLMVIVAHPQLPKDLAIHYPLFFETDKYSSVYYDLVHYSEVVTLGYIPIEDKIVRLYAMGKLWDTYSSKIAELIDTLEGMNLGTETEIPEFE